MNKLKKGDVCMTGTGLRVVLREFVKSYQHWTVSDPNGYPLPNQFYPESSLTPLTGIDAAVKGSVVVDEYGGERAVIGVCGDTAFTDNRGVSCHRSYAEMKSFGWTLKGAPTDDRAAEAIALLKSQGYVITKEPNA